MLHDRQSRLDGATPRLRPSGRLADDRALAVRTGAELRLARDRLGLTLQAVAADLRIRLPHLQALEGGRISQLPGHAYAQAFVRAYASLLGLNPEEMVRRFNNETASVTQRTELVFPVPMPERGVSAGALVLLGLLLSVGVYAGWYHLSGEGRLSAETVTAVPERMLSLAEQTLPEASDHGVEAAKDLPQPPTSAPTVSSTSTKASLPTFVATLSPTLAAAAQLPSRPAGSTAVAVLSTVPAGSMAAGRIVLRANAATWLMVKDRAGAVLLNKLLKSGESWPVPPRPDLLLTTGNAGGTDVVVDGMASQGLGGNGVVRRDLVLDPDQLRHTGPGNAATMPLASGHGRQ